jgi:hypothetical protein
MDEPQKIPGQMTVDEAIEIARHGLDGKSPGEPGHHKKPFAAGAKFGRLTVLRVTANPPNRNRHYDCRCDCGGLTVVAGHNLRGGNVRSCGCLAREHAAEMGRVGTHGLSRTPTYRSWQTMVQRTNSKSPDWEHYGGRGIKVCDRWRSFDLFLADVGERPEGTTLGRLADEGDYEPGNARWMTQAEQVRNRQPRSSRETGLDGKDAVSGRHRRPTVSPHIKRPLSVAEAVKRMLEKG